MSEMSIDDIYAANDTARESFIQMVGSLSNDELNAELDGEKWPIVHVVEHVAMVEEGMSKICAKLLREAQAAGAGANGTQTVSENYTSRSREIVNMKLEAPERVRPSGEKPVAESLAKMEVNRAKLEDIRPMFEAYDSQSFKFPHPFFGDLSAIEWLTLIGEHEKRHLKQIESLLEKIRQ